MKRIAKFPKLIDYITGSDMLTIYGAGTMGYALKKCLSEKPYNQKIQCFIVNSIQDNPNVIDGIPVIDILHASVYIDAVVVIALNGKLIYDATQSLIDAGFKKLLQISFDGDEWTYIRHGWIAENNILPQRVFYLSSFKCDNVSDYSKICNIHIYVVHSIYDRKLNRDIDLKGYEIPIQVGAGLTDSRLFGITDLHGDNISLKNKQYCELTGIYWAWKNDTSDYIGFSHYRRRFVLSVNQIDYICSGEVDVIVTEPILNFATVKGQYYKDHDGRDWEILIEAISKFANEYLDAAKKIQDGIYYFAYNMFIMKRNILNQYCNFIFPILEYCEKKIGKKEDTYQNRYIGFLAERLLSIFLEKNDYLKVAIADKTFLE